jgi:hypothetical protein
MFERRSQRALFVKAAEGVKYSAVAAVINTARGVRNHRVALMPLKL